MMGDNRDNSTDSRVPGPGGVGYVPFENLVGRAEIIFFSVEDGSNGLGDLEVAVDGPLGSAVQAPMSNGRRRRSAALERRLGHQLRRPQASARRRSPIRAPQPAPQDSYQRLEFLGDRVLGLVVAEMLLEAFPEGDRRRARPAADRTGPQGDLRRGGDCPRSRQGASGSAAAKRSRAAATRRRSSATSARR